MRSRHLCFALALLLCLGCGGSPSKSPTATSSGPHVFLLVEENTSYETVVNNPAMPYLNGLAQQFGLATQYYANTHPSIGNYFMLTTGQLITNDDAFTGTVSADNVVRELTNAGKSWKYYGESLPSVGYTGGDVFPYLKHHNPFAYFTDVLNSTSQQQNLVPFSQFAADLNAGTLPSYSFIVPNAQNDGHDCPAGMPTCTTTDRLAAMDRWLQANIDPLVKSSGFQAGGTLILVFDESAPTDTRNGGGRVACVVVSAAGKHGFQSAVFHQHASTLRTTLERLNVSSFPGAAATANDLGEFF